MTWVRLDDAFSEHPKIAALGDSALALWVVGLAYCNRNLTDGFVPTQVGLGQLRFCDGNAVPAIRELEAAGLWELIEGGWIVHDYLDYQPSKQASLELKKARAEAGSRGGKASSRAKDKHLLEQNSSKPQAEANPVPVPKTTPEEQDQEQDQKQAAKDSRTSAVVAALSGIGKPGYLPAKLTVARIDALLVKHPSLDVVDEAEKLRDWETYGAGEGGQTKDGVARFRRWLDKAEEPAANGHEVDYPWLPGCEPKRP